MDATSEALDRPTLLIGAHEQGIAGCLLEAAQERLQLGRRRVIARVQHYAAKGVASIMGGGLAAKLFEKTGSWDYGFYTCAVLALCSSFLAFRLGRMPLPRKQTTEYVHP